MKDSIREAIRLYYLEKKIITDERYLLDQREDLCFQRFIERCNLIHEQEHYNLDYNEWRACSS